MRRHVAPAVAAMLGIVACQGGTIPPAPPPVVQGPPAIPDTQPAVDAPLFVGQNAFPAPIGHQSDFSPALATVRADAGNSGVIDGPAPLGRAPVTGSAAVSIQPPLLWGRRGGLTAGCRIELAAGVIKNCLAAVDTATISVLARWSPPGQDLNLASAVVDDNQRVIVTTRQRHLFVVARPDTDGGPFRVVRDIDLGAHLGDGQGLWAAVSDSGGNLWFVSGGPPPARDAATGTTVGYVTADDQVVTATLAGQQVDTGLAVDQGNVYLATAPALPTDHTGSVLALTAAPGKVETLWNEPYDAGSAARPGGDTRGTASAVMLLGSQYLALTDKADDQAHLLVYLRGALPGATGHGGTTSTIGGATGPTGSTTATAATSTTATSGAKPAPQTAPPTATAPATGATSPDPRLVCTVGLFASGASTVTTAPIAYAGADGASVIVANGHNDPPPLVNPSDGGPANNINQMASGVTRVDVAPDGAGCHPTWTTALRLKTSPVLSSTTGLLYGYTQDEARAAGGRYVWYFVAVDYRSGRIVWRQRAGAGSTKNDSRQPLALGANGVLYQSVPLGLVWMRDVAQRP